MKVVIAVTYCRREVWYIVRFGQGNEKKDLVRHYIQKWVYYAVSAVCE